MSRALDNNLVYVASLQNPIKIVLCQNDFCSVSRYFYSYREHCTCSNANTYMYDLCESEQMQLLCVDMWVFFHENCCV